MKHKPLTVTKSIEITYADVLAYLRQDPANVTILDITPVVLGALKLLSDAEIQRCVDLAEEDPNAVSVVGLRNLALALTAAADRITEHLLKLPVKE